MQDQDQEQEPRLVTKEYWQDFNGRRIAVGSNVTSADPSVQGVVSRIEEADFDYDDELERGVQYGPYVWVEWPNAEMDERFTGTALDRQDPLLFTFDDLDVIEGGGTPT